MFCLEALIDLAVALLNRCSSRRRSWRWPSHTRVRNRSTTTITRFTVDNFFFFSAKLVWITAIAVVRFSRRTISRRRFPISRVIQAARRRFPSSSLLARSIFRVSVLCRFIILLRGRCVGKWKNNDFDFVYFILESSFLFQFSWSFRGNESTESTTPDLLFARRYNILFFFCLPHVRVRSGPGFASEWENNDFDFAYFIWRIFFSLLSFLSRKLVGAQHLLPCPLALPIPPRNRFCFVVAKRHVEVVCNHCDYISPFFLYRQRFDSTSETRI